MHFFTKKAKAFTLIELLVVVSIISLLSTIIVVGVSTIRTKARNGAIKTNLNFLRQAGELWYTKGDTYTGFCVDDNCNSGSGDWQNICKAVKDQNGNQAVTCNIVATAWCASSPLVGGGSYCVDSNANAKEGVVCGAGYACP